MRLILLSLILPLAGCTAMLLGSGNGGKAPGGDSRTEARIAADAATTTAVQDRLVADPMLGRYDFIVQTFDGRVTLRGSVGSYSARSRAGQVAAGVGGVASVNNRISVATGN
jgi:hyperosmotically inducible periplasmic protein